ncbi:flagellar biosynthesis protein FlhF [Pseudoteredinibacter isoporae]|uniref:Flagellar biosynthesis protein FlhF n=1 Tax=Pseudoteredinibacter isoporae TaxID=570281 RepID=A0A7X0MZS2_9GAMM|nr:flagellar biosynthesis protein FlhF [Pseudoteredinibacter isoporae]MBB6523457.1 flagellar biosynthesis protein FlhF [Pseudoteredinibacter isoporae]NHO88966.1 flagellar biosynthesis protein FlhF [Pseudoteredinibacter isoporae]NIB24326.1 flagellar biosynthesis protein FlhF [Pseudoteredinibacter isoporae]
MQVKRFVAADMRRALELVRHELGPEAVILSNHRTEKGVEVMASLELPEKPSPVPSKHLQDSTAAPYDVPMASDQAWQQQIQSQQLAETMSGASLESASPQLRGQASGKTREELAEEVASARDKMLAARNRAEADAAPSPAPARRSAAVSNFPAAAAMARQQTTPTQAAPSHQDVAAHWQGTAQAMPQPQLQVDHFPGQNPNFSSVPHSQTQVDHQAMQRELRAPAHPAPVQPQAMEVDDKMKLLMAELSDMRSLLEEQIAQTTHQAGVKNPVVESVRARLQKLGLSQAVIKQLLNRLNPGQSIGDSWNETLSHLTQSIPVLPKDITEQGGVFAFVGPTGVGKTTTVGKLAARYVMKHGPEQVALITTDTYRIAAHDQLRALGAILKVPVKVVEEDENLKDVIDSFKQRSLILIDTAGFRHGDPMLHQQLSLVQQHRSVRSYLVMAANSQWQMLKASAHAYAGRGLSGAVLSKLDETTGLGEALSVIIEHDLPLAYSTDGQNIPQDIAVARSQHLVSTALELGQLDEAAGKKSMEF